MIPLAAKPSMIPVLTNLEKLKDQIEKTQDVEIKKPKPTPVIVQK